MAVRPGDEHPRLPSVAAAIRIGLCEDAFSLAQRPCRPNLRHVWHSGRTLRSRRWAVGPEGLVKLDRALRRGPVEHQGEEDLLGHARVDEA